MSDALLACYRKAADESPTDFGKRPRASVTELAADDRAREVVLLVDDGDSGAPPEATAYPCQFDAALVTSGLPMDVLPDPDPACAVGRRVIKARERGRDGARSEGFTVICPSVRAPFLTHDAFDTHWRNNH